MNKQQAKRAMKRQVHRPGGGSLLNDRELAAEKGETVKTINTWRRNGIIPFIDAGFRCKRYDLYAVNAALAKRAIKAK